MPNPYEGYVVVWNEDKSVAYLKTPWGKIIAKWFRDRPADSTFDPFETEKAISGGAPAPPEPAAPPTGEGVYGYEVVSDEFWPGFIQHYEDVWEAKAAYSAWLEQTREEEWAREEETYAQRREEERAYAEQLLQESLARQLAQQQAGQEEAWPSLVSRAQGMGLGALSARMPAYMPESVGGALFDWGEALGSYFEPAWPGGTELGVAQPGPTEEDFLNYIINQGFPGYILR